MAEMYMRNIRDWKDATLMLSFEEKGYFSEILDLIYLYDDCLPDDDNLICKAMPVNKKIHLRLKQKLLEMGLISVQNGFIHNSRSTQELLKINSISSQNKVKAGKRWSKSLEKNKTGDAAAYAGADAGAILNSESEYIIKNNPPNPPSFRERPADENFDCLLNDCFDAAELDPSKILNPRIHVGSTEAVKDWIAAGGDFAEHIKPAIREALNAGRMNDPGFHPKTLKYYRQAVLDRIDKANPAGEWEDTDTPQWRIRVGAWKQNHRWMTDLHGPPPDDPETLVPPVVLTEFGIASRA